MSTIPGSAQKNQILAALPDDVYQRLLPHLEAVDLTNGKVLYEIDEVIEYLYFPYDAMISLVTQMADGKIVEVGLVGNDGMSGIGSLMGQNKSYERAIVQIPNGGARISVEVMRKEFEADEEEAKRIILESQARDDAFRQDRQKMAASRHADSRPTSGKLRAR